MRDDDFRGQFVGMPAENHLVCDGLNVHVGCANDGFVFKRIFNDFLVKPFILAPTGDYKQILKMVGEGRNVKITADAFGHIAVIGKGTEVFAKHELMQSDLGILVWGCHAGNYIPQRPKVKAIRRESEYNPVCFRNRVALVAWLLDASRLAASKTTANLRLLFSPSYL